MVKGEVKEEGREMVKGSEEAWKKVKVKVDEG